MNHSSLLTYHFRGIHQTYD